MPRSPLRLIPLVGALVAALAVTGPALAASDRTATSTDAPLAARVLSALNAIRVQHSLVPLETSAPLRQAAAVHSLEMAQDGFFAHHSQDGTPFWKRILTSYSPLPGQVWSVGENLVWSTGNLDADEALKLWLASPEHRANILTPRWRQVGISVVHAAHAPGVYSQQTVTIITTDFGVR